MSVLLYISILAVSAPAEAQRNVARYPPELADVGAGTLATSFRMRASPRVPASRSRSRRSGRTSSKSAPIIRVPTVRIRIEQALNAIGQADRDHVFLLQRDQDPNQLSLTIYDSSLSIRRR